MLARLTLLLSAALLSVVSCGEAESAPKATTDAGDSSSNGNNNSGNDASLADLKGEPAECGAELCEGFVIPDINVPLTACCGPEDQCGVDVSLFGQFLGLPRAGCEELDRPGAVDPTCPDSEPIENDLLTEPLTLEGCCMPSGRCGFVADFEVLNFGCVAPEEVEQEQDIDCGGSDAAAPDADSGN